MSTRPEIIAELEEAPNDIIEEVYHFLRSLKTKAAALESGSRSDNDRIRPDFLGRQNVLFGERALQDSQEVLDEIRADRF